MQNKMKRFALLLLVAVMVLSTFSAAFATSSSPNAVSLKKAKVTLLASKGEYTGSVQEIPVKVTLNGVELKEGVDYIITDNWTSGSKAKKYTAKICVVGIGHYKGYFTKKVKYTITKATQNLSVKAPDDTDTIRVSAADLKNGAISVQAKVSDTVLSQAITGKLVWKTTKKIKASQTGMITIPKGLKAGTYTIKVYAKKSTNYNNSAYQYIKIVVS